LTWKGILQIQFARIACNPQPAAKNAATQQQHQLRKYTGNNKQWLLQFSKLHVLMKSRKLLLTTYIIYFFNEQQLHAEIHGVQQIILAVPTNPTTVYTIQHPAMHTSC
jgi:hypothetical protein